MAYAHPLDPLSPDEIKTTASVVRSAVSQKRLKNLRFNTITLKVICVLGCSCYISKLDSLVATTLLCDTIYVACMTGIQCAGALKV